MAVNRPVKRLVNRAMARRLTQPGAGGGGGGDPLLAAALALNPVWLYDHKDIGSFFTDTAMTTPAAVGDPVAAVMDKSGNGRHRTQSTLASSPILRQSGDLYYLEYDGTDDFMQVSAINLTGTDAVTVCFGLRKTSDATIGIFIEFGTNVNSVNGSFSIWAPSSNGGANSMYVVRGTAVSSASAVSFASPATAVITGLSDISADVCIQRRNGVQVATSASDQGTGNYGNHVLYFGRRAGTSFPFVGRDYGGCLYASQLSGDDLDAVEAFVASRSGVTL